MQITRNKDAQSTKLLGWFKQIGHHYGHHASRRRRSYADMRVLQRQAQPGLDPQPFSSLQKWIGRRFAIFVVATTDDLVETIHQTVRGQMAVHCCSG